MYVLYVIVSYIIASVFIYVCYYIMHIIILFDYIYKEIYYKELTLLLMEVRSPKSAVRKLETQENNGKFPVQI